MKKVKLNNGEEMPILGLGTLKATGKKAKQAVKWALETGYRHIDTAAIYGNEEEVGEAIKESGIPREEIFITTKLWNSDHDDPEAALDESLKKLGTNYADLYLIHWPVAERNQSWKKMEKFLKEGRCKSIGVSNFTIKHLKELMKKTNIKPAVNQVEFSPFLYQKELLEFCRENDIQLEAYSPLTRAKKLDHPVLKEIAEKHGKTTAQVMIRWAIEHEVVVIPKSTNQERIKENIEVFDFELEEMKKLDSLNKDFRTCWDPHEIE